MSFTLLVIFYSLVGGLFSLVGGLALLIKPKLTERVSIHLVSFAAGVLIATAFLDILPEALHESTQTITPFLGVIAGIISFYVIERLIVGIHAHDDAKVANRQALPWLVTTGDTVHNFIDGVAIAGTFLIDVRLGIITSLAVAAHEIPHEIGDFAILLKSGWSKKAVVGSNVASSLASTLGAILTLLAANFINPYLPGLLGFAAGTFVYIALTDLVPDLHHSSRQDNPWHISAMLLLGIAVVYGAISLLE